MELLITNLQFTLHITLHYYITPAWLLSG